jgi:GH24 family phage-related lysozyme (muramidase)
MSYEYDKLVDQLILNEGLRLTPYRDTMGYLTIGVGHLIGKNESFTPSRVSNADFERLRSEAIRVTSTSTIEVSCAEI